jgi:hypothetical protein
MAVLGDPRIGINNLFPTRKKRFKRNGRDCFCLKPRIRARGLTDSITQLPFLHPDPGVWDQKPTMLFDPGACPTVSPIFWRHHTPPKFWMVQIITYCNGAQIFSGFAVVAPAFVLVAGP